MGSFLDGLGYLFGKIPLQDRIERIKNKINDLETEQRKLMGEPWDVKKAKRVSDIDFELAHQRRLLENAAPSK